MDNVEIERRFLVAKVPLALDKYEKHNVVDGYPFIAKAKYLRIRNSDGKYTLTFKKGEGLIRVEKQMLIDKETFDELWRGTDEDWKIKRTRYIIPHRGKKVELDVFDGRLKGLIIAEIELDSEDEKIELPHWLGKEITHNRRLTNYVTNSKYVLSVLESLKKKGK